MALLTTQVLRVCRFRHLSPLSQDNDNSALLVAQWLCSRVIQKSSPWPAFHIPANPTCSSPWHIDPELPSLPLSQLSVCYLLFKLPNQPPQLISVHPVPLTDHTAHTCVMVAYTLSVEAKGFVVLWWRQTPLRLDWPLSLHPSFSSAPQPLSCLSGYRPPSCSWSYFSALSLLSPPLSGVRQLTPLPLATPF